MKVGLDTSVVLRLLVGEPANQAQVALGYLGELKERGGRAVVSDLVVSETYFALQYHYQVPKAEALKALRELLASGIVEGRGVASEVLAGSALESSKPGFVDRIIHRQYLRTVGAMATFEKAAHRLSHVSLLG